jgi:predicted NAD/FAD-dependent oxidoreductase
MSPPTEPQALHVLRHVQGLNAEQFRHALSHAVGEPMMQVFVALAQSMHPDDGEDARAQKVHLMMLAWLMAREHEATARAPA